MQPFDARRMHKRLSGQDCEDREGRTDISMQVKIYTDGAARGNPDGPGGYGAILEYVDTKGTLHTKELSLGICQNNKQQNGTDGSDRRIGSVEQTL